MKRLSITKEAFEKSKYFKNKYGKLEYVSESGKLFKTSKGKVLMFKESSTDDLYGFYEWLKSNTQHDEGVHVKFYDNEDGSESVELWFDDRYQWDDDVADGTSFPEEDSGVQDWIRQCKKQAEKNHWDFSTDEYAQEVTLDNRIFSISLGSPAIDDEQGDEYQESTKSGKNLSKEGTESNPRFKCMEDGTEDQDNTRFSIEVVDEDGHFDDFMIDLADESDWGNINTADGSCYFPSGEEFDGIGWGNDEDGYLKIVSVKRNMYQDNEEEISTREFVDIVDSLTGLYSDM